MATPVWQSIDHEDIKDGDFIRDIRQGVWVNQLGGGFGRDAFEDPANHYFERRIEVCDHMTRGEVCGRPRADHPRINGYEGMHAFT